MNFTFHIKMPIFVARQWLHTEPLASNEISGRPAMKAEFYVPDSRHINLQSEDNGQGWMDEVSTFWPKSSGDPCRRQKQAMRPTRSFLRWAWPVSSPINLPLSMYTEWYWQMDLHNLFHFLASARSARPMGDPRLRRTDIGDHPPRVRLPSKRSAAQGRERDVQRSEQALRRA